MAKLLLAASLALAAIPAFGAARPGEEELMDARAKLEKMLTENISPFWHPGVIDRDNGGYKLNHDNTVLTIFSRRGPPYFNEKACIAVLDSTIEWWLSLIHI